MPPQFGQKNVYKINLSSHFVRLVCPRNFKHEHAECLRPRRMIAVINVALFVPTCDFLSNVFNSQDKYSLNMFLVLLFSILDINFRT